MQEELEFRALSLVLKDRENLMDFLKNGIITDSFIIHDKIWDFITQYYIESGDVPPVVVVKDKFQEFHHKDDVRASEINYTIKKLTENEIHRKTITAMHKAEEKITEHPVESLDELVNTLIGIRQTRQYTRAYTDKDCMYRLEEAKERKESIQKNDVIGINTGLDILDAKHIGWQPGDLVGIVGRTNIGKTWLLLYISIIAWKHGYRVLFISPEISRKKLELRWDLLASKMHNYNFPFSKILEGDLDYARYKEWLEFASKRGDWLTVESYYGSQFKVPSIQSIVTEFSPDLVAVDGISLIHGKGLEDWEKVKSVAYGLKAVASTTQKVILCTSQANKETSRNEGWMPTLETVAGSYAVSQACDIIVAIGPQYMEQGKGKEVTKLMDANARAISLIKMREGVTQNARTPLNFDIENGDIGIIPQ